MNPDNAPDVARLVSEKQPGREWRATAGELAAALRDFARALGASPAFAGLAVHKYGSWSMLPDSIEELTIYRLRSRLNWFASSVM